MKAALLALSLILLGAIAGAEDACLTGASLLADQRAIAALRAATEAVCPCASFAMRQTYRKCARGVRRDALAQGDLRPACEQTFARLTRGAVCGSDKVACGRFAPGSRTPVSCRVKRAAACHDRRAFSERACAGQTYCADVVDWTAGTCVDVRTFGPFVPGVRMATFTKQSAVDPTQQRALDTVIWYPAPPGSAPFDPGFGGVHDAPLDGSAAPYPLLLFSHGSCGYSFQSTFLTPLLASYGFVVAAPSHAGNTIFEFPTCGTPTALVNSAVERPQDVVFVTDQMLLAAADPISPFFGSIDGTRIGMSGHSFGGFTTYLVVALDARFQVAVPLAPAVPGAPVVDVPSLTMLGQIDSVVNNAAIRTAYADALVPKFLAEVKNAGHYAFSDLCFPSPDCAPPATLTQDEAHLVVLRFVAPFLKVYLAGDEAFRPFLVPPAPPSADFEGALQ
jgi:predicted dienelactone hydrolase